MVSPFLLEFEQWEAALWNDLGVGVIVTCLALSRSSGNKLAVNLMVLLGIWLIVSPFVLDFTAATPFWTNIILGLLIALSALLASALHRDTNQSEETMLNGPERNHDFSRVKR